jgi:hypothetical protein
MGDLKPLGSEKLQGDNKLKRILELTYYNESKNNATTSNKPELVKEGKNGVYGIVKEKDGYHVKKGLTESTLDYIGGMFMKNKNKFNSYAEALKRLELIKSQELQEATNYVLKTNKPKTEAPMPAPSFDSAPAPSAGEPAPAPAPDAAPAREEEPALPPSDSEETGDEAPEGDMGGEGGPEHMKEVQRLSGKLGQAIREVQDDMESDDVKYVINMLLSAVNLEKLSEEDKEEIVDKFEPEEGQPGDETSYGDEEEFKAEEEPIPSPEGEMDETMSSLEELINTDFDLSGEETEMGEWFYFDPENETGDEPVAPRYKSVSGDDMPNRLTTSSKMNGTWYNDKDDAYGDFDGADYDEEDFDDHDSYMSKHGDSNVDLRYKPDFERHKPIKVRTLKKKDDLDITPELTEINEAIKTTLSKYFE